jgi:hypothetical protein
MLSVGEDVEAHALRKRGWCQRSRRFPHWRPREVPADGHWISPVAASGTPRGRPWFFPGLALQGHHSLPGTGVG